MRRGTGLLKFLVLVGILFTIIQKVTGSTEFTSNFLQNIWAIIVVGMPAIIVLAGLYILIK